MMRTVLSWKSVMLKATFRFFLPHCQCCLIWVGELNTVIENNSFHCVTLYTHKANYVSTGYKNKSFCRLKTNKINCIANFKKYGKTNLIIMTFLVMIILSLSYLFNKLNQKSLIHQCFGCQILLSYCVTDKSKNLGKKLKQFRMKKYIYKEN